VHYDTVSMEEDTCLHKSGIMLLQVEIFALKDEALCRIAIVYGIFSHLCE
jgi:hypothetical protein